MDFSRKKNFIFLFVCLGIFLVSVLLVAINGVIYVFSRVSSTDFFYTASLSGNQVPAQSPTLPAVKAIYLKRWPESVKSYVDALKALDGATRPNALVVDIKDDSGLVSYTAGAPKDWVIQELHNQGVYVIGRISAFKDSALAKKRPDLAVYDRLATTNPSKPVIWKDANGFSWVDPASEEVWDYTMKIAQDALALGFDEIQFDHVSFPASSQKNTLGYPAWDGKTPKHVIIKSVFKKIRETFPSTPISITLPGPAATATDDMGVGVIFEDALDYFDYVSPVMVFPEQAEDALEYEVFKNALTSALSRREVHETIHSTKSGLAMIRPWLGVAQRGGSYDPMVVLEATKAVSEAMGAGSSGFMLCQAKDCAGL